MDSMNRWLWFLATVFALRFVTYDWQPPWVRAALSMGTAALMIFLLVKQFRLERAAKRRS